MASDGRANPIALNANSVPASVTKYTAGTERRSRGRVLVGIFSTTVVIERPVGRVFEYLADPENEKDWQGGLVESRKTSAGPMGVGATGEDVRMSMGRRMVTSWTCTGWEPDSSFAFRVTKPVPFAARYLLEAVNGGTRLTMTAEPTGFTRLLWPLITRAGRRQYEENFATLRRVLESR